MRVRACVSACVRAYVCACVRACVRACVNECLYVTNTHRSANIDDSQRYRYQRDAVVVFAGCDPAPPVHVSITY